MIYQNLYHSPIGEDVGGVEGVHRRGGAKGAGGEDLADQPGDLAERKGEHDRPGGAGDLAVGG